MRLIAKSIVRQGTAPAVSAQVARVFDCLPPEMKRAALFMPEQERNRLEEIRLRAGREVTVTVDGCERVLARDGRLYEIDGLGRGIVCPAEYIQYTVEKASDGFVYSAEETIRQGFITLRGGHRIGLCGHAVTAGGEISAINGFSSVCIRVARDIEGISAEGAEAVYGCGRLNNTLIISSPLTGKTTYLRDLIRELSKRRIRTGICDERSEIAALVAGEPQFAIGHFIDVIDGCRKSDAAMLLLRAMSPQVIAMDEITAPCDVEAICRAANCGVSVVATAHADDVRELYRRRIYAPLLENRIFSRVLHLTRQGGERACAVYEVTDGDVPC